MHDSQKHSRKLDGIYLRLQPHLTGGYKATGCEAAQPLGRLTQANKVSTSQHADGTTCNLLKPPTTHSLGSSSLPKLKSYWGPNSDNPPHIALPSACGGCALGTGGRVGLGRPSASHGVHGISNSRWKGSAFKETPLSLRNVRK